VELRIDMWRIMGNMFSNADIGQGGEWHKRFIPIHTMEFKQHHMHVTVKPCCRFFGKFFAFDFFLPAFRMDDSVVPDGSVPHRSPKRRKLVFERVEQYSLPAVEDCREAARSWAAKQNILVGAFSTPQLTPADQWITTARCSEHEGCWSNQGTVFRFLATTKDAVTRIEISRAGDCCGEPRKCRSARQHEGQEITVAERRLLGQLADELQETGRSATTSSVAVRLTAATDGKVEIAASRIRHFLRHRRSSQGQSTRRFQDTCHNFPLSVVHGFQNNISD